MAEERGESSTRADVIREALEAWNGGDIEAMVELCEPDVELVPRMARLQGEPYRGHDGVRRWFSDSSESWDVFVAAMDEVREEGDRMLGLGRIRWRGKGSGAAAEESLGWVWRFRGRRIASMRVFDDPDEARREFEGTDDQIDPSAKTSNQRLHDRFVRLCEIPSPTGEEREVADAVAAELRDLGHQVGEDGAAEAARAGSGNLLTRVPGREDRWVMFCAHLDTVPHAGKVEVVLSDGVYRSGGETILGADDKAAVAVLIELAARHTSSPPPVGIELLFTVAEEEGLRGAKAFDVASLRSDFGFVLDHATPIGELITAAPSYQRIVAEFAGEEAHAGIRPEAGHSAIAAASTAVAAMELGRLDEVTTANVGTISGGTAANVVPARCRIEGEARSIDAPRAAEVVGAMSDACAFGATEHSCDVEVEVEELWRSYRVSSGSEPLRVASAALERRGHEVKKITTGGGSDAHALIAAGFDCLLLANGTEANHTPDETVAAANLDAMLDVCEAILEVAAG